MTDNADTKANPTIDATTWPAEVSPTMDGDFAMLLWAEALLTEAAAKNATAPEDADRLRRWAATAEHFARVAPEDCTAAELAQGFSLLKTRQSDIDEADASFYAAAYAALGPPVEGEPETMVCALWSLMAANAASTGDARFATALAVEGHEIALAIAGCVRSPEHVKEAREMAARAQTRRSALAASVRTAFPDARAVFDDSASLWMTASQRMPESVTVIVDGGRACLVPAAPVTHEGDRHAVITTRFAPVPVMMVLRALREEQPLAFAEIHAMVAKFSAELAASKASQ